MFKWFNRKNKQITHSIYETITLAARREVFFRELQVPDTLTGRFDMLCLFVTLTVHDLMQRPEKNQQLAQDLLNHFASHIDHYSREAGVSDLKIPKWVKKYFSVYSGRYQAYVPFLETENRAGLSESFLKNIYANNQQNKDKAQILADYALDVCKHIKEFKDDIYFQGKFSLIHLNL